MSLTAWIAADFDGDRNPDLARTGAFQADGTGFLQEVRLRFSAAESGTILVRTAAVAWHLVARDVDGDSDRDLILETLFREPLAILLNDGGGHFHQGRVEDFDFLFSHQERCSWEAGCRLASEMSASDASQNDASPPNLKVACRELTPAGAVETYDSVVSSAMIHGPATRGPPIA